MMYSNRLTDYTVHNNSLQVLLDDDEGKLINTDIKTLLKLFPCSSYKIISYLNHKVQLQRLKTNYNLYNCNFLISRCSENANNSCNHSIKYKVPYSL